MADTNESTVTSTVTDFFSNAYDGFKIGVGLKDGEINTVGQRMGIHLPTAAAAVVAYTRLVQKPAMTKSLGEKEQKALKDATPVSRILLGA